MRADTGWNSLETIPLWKLKINKIDARRRIKSNFRCEIRVKLFQLTTTTTTISRAKVLRHSSRKLIFPNSLPTLIWFGFCWFSCVRSSMRRCCCRCRCCWLEILINLFIRIPFDGQSVRECLPIVSLDKFLFFINLLIQPNGFQLRRWPVIFYFIWIDRLMGEWRRIFSFPSLCSRLFLWVSFTFFVLCCVVVFRRVVDVVVFHSLFGFVPSIVVPNTHIIIKNENKKLFASAHTQYIVTLTNLLLMTHYIRCLECGSLCTLKASLFAFCSSKATLHTTVFVCLCVCDCGHFTTACDTKPCNRTLKPI